MPRAAALLRHLLVPFVVSGVLAGTLYTDALVLGDLLGRCPDTAFTPAFGLNPPRCDSPRLVAVSFLAVLAVHLLAVAAVVGSAALSATEKKFSAALGAALLGTWAVLVVGVVTADFDGFRQPVWALPLMQTVVVFWAGLCVYRVRRRYGTALEWPQNRRVAAVLTGLLLLIPYGAVFAASFRVLAAGLVAYRF